MNFSQLFFTHPGRSSPKESPGCLTGARDYQILRAKLREVREGDKAHAYMLGREGRGCKSEGWPLFLGGAGPNQDYTLCKELSAQPSALAQRLQSLYPKKKKKKNDLPSQHTIQPTSEAEKQALAGAGPCQSPLGSHFSPVLSHLSSTPFPCLIGGSIRLSLHPDPW